MTRTLLLGALVAISLSAAPVAQSAAPASTEKAVDEIFAKWSSTTPGCAVGVAVGGTPVLVKAYGMADLEHDVRNTADTIFESGSLSKQFTAMAIMLLVKDDKLSLDDPVRKYIPELPDYKVPLTIRHMLTHTSGLRDWGSIESIAGWPRTTREYTHAHVLDIVSRQESLNFKPGDHYSYSNTGYNLSAIIVSRVSGMSFADFSKRRIFEPLGLTHTSWRDDHTRIVKNRAIAYSESNGAFSIEMPFENVHGNGGLLTTVGDLLKWNENFVNPRVGDAALVSAMQTTGKFNDGKPQDYALGLMVQKYRGVSNINHSGSTAGYRAHLNRFPDSRTSVAVLCNVSSGDATRSANRVSDVYVPNMQPPSAAAAATPPPAPLNPQPGEKMLAEFAGSYFSQEAEVAIAVAIQDGALVLKRRPDSVMKMVAIGPDKFRSPIGTITFIRESGSVTSFGVNQERVWDLRFRRTRVPE